MRRALIVSLVVAPLLGACCDCDPEGHARDFAGGGAIDCGFVPVGEDREAAIACAEEAIANGEPFFVGYGRVGRDTELRTYVTGAGDGTYAMLAYDGGLSGSCASLTVFDCTAALQRSSDPLGGAPQLTCPTSGPRETLCGD